MRRVANAVLDTPAGNTYMQRQAEVSLRDFLTRRAVNTVMYYMAEMHDGPSRDFLRRFDDFEHKVKTDQFQDGEAYLDRMLRAQREKGTMRVGHPSGRFSRTYQFTIEPNRIAKRIIESRLQLAGEWARDLRCIEAENLEIQRLGFEKMLCQDKTELDSKRNLIFECDPFSNDDTPLRYKNYMALKTLTTQHAVARLLPYTRDSGPNHDYMYLLQFVDKHGPIKNGDDFVRSLMDRPLENRTNPAYTIHPRSIGLQILELRLVIAQEWTHVMNFIPEEHKMMTRRMLEKSMKISDVHGEDIRRPSSSPEDPDAKPSFEKGGETRS